MPKLILTYGLPAKVNKLTLIKIEGKDKRGNKLAHCKCDCGNSKIIRKSAYKSGQYQTCGCRMKQYFAKGKKAWNWKGGRRIEDGYVLLYKPYHHKAKSNGYVREHQLVMENIIGRKLLSNENIHHINGCKSDNSPENLELWVKSQPPGQRAKDLVKWAKEILKIYNNDTICQN